MIYRVCVYTSHMLGKEFKCFLFLVERTIKYIDWCEKISRYDSGLQPDTKSFSLGASQGVLPFHTRCDQKRGTFAHLGNKMLLASSNFQVSIVSIELTAAIDTRGDRIGSIDRSSLYQIRHCISRWMGYGRSPSGFPLSLSLCAYLGVLYESISCIASTSAFRSILLYLDFAGQKHEVGQWMLLSHWDSEQLSWRRMVHRCGVLIWPKCDC